jgi:3',5'-cyclic AMP phosphodiesterase CpdA
MAIRIAHWTDIHAATNAEVWKTAMLHVGAGIALAAPVVAAFEAVLSKVEKPTKDKLRIPVYGLAGVAAVAGMSIHPKLRRRLLFLRDVALLVNQSSEQRRAALYRSLREQKVDHLLITGDLSTSSRPGEFEQVADELQRHGWEGNRVTILPGNHDRIGFDGSVAFEKFFPMTAIPPVYEIAPGVIVAGIDSTMTPPNRSLWSGIWDDVATNLQGNISYKSIEFLRRRLDGVTDETLIVGIHHPILDLRPPVKRLRKALRPAFVPPTNTHALAAILRPKHNFILCGHDHPPAARFGEHDGLQVFMGTASGLVASTRKRQKRLSYRIFDVGPRGECSRKDVFVNVE